MMFKIIIYLIIVYYYFSYQALALNQMEVNIIKSSLQNNFSIQLIDKFCKNEDPGLDIDTYAGNYLFFKKKCKCSINSGKYINSTEAYNSFYNCILKE